MLYWVLYALVIVAVLTAAEGVLLLVGGDPTSRKKTVKQRLQRHASHISEVDDYSSGILIDRDSDQSLMGRIARGLARRKELELLLYRAGMPFTLVQFLLLTLTLGVGGPIVALALGSPVLAVLLVCLGVLPLIYVLLRKRERMRQFEAQMPEALDLICRALRAGISLEFGFRSVGDELNDPAGTEFSQVADEVSLGLDTRVALQNLAMRMNTSDMPFFVNAVLIQRETGGNLAEILDNLSNIIRDRIKFHGKVKSLVAQVKLQADILALMPFVFVGALLLVAPDYLEPLKDPPGLYLVYAIAVMVPVGWLLCRRIASVRS